MNEVLTAMAVLTPVVIGLTEVAKRAARLPDRLAPVVAIALGVAAALLFDPALPWRDELATGVLAGLSASGLWSGTRATVLGR